MTIHPLWIGGGRVGRYRWRTVLRRHLPAMFGRLFPKGKGDCGRHDWYRAEDGIWECYHCVAFTRVCPWLATEPPSDDDVERAKAIARERGWLTDEGWVWKR